MLFEQPINSFGIDACLPQTLQFAIDDRSDAFVAKVGEFAKDCFDPLKQVLIAYQVSSLSTTMTAILPISLSMQ